MTSQFVNILEYIDLPTVLSYATTFYIKMSSNHYDMPELIVTYKMIKEIQNKICIMLTHVIK